MLLAKMDEQSQQLRDLTMQQAEHLEGVAAKQGELGERVATLQGDLQNVQSRMQERLRVTEEALTDFEAGQKEMLGRQKALREELRGELLEELSRGSHLRPDAPLFVPSSESTGGDGVGDSKSERPWSGVSYRGGTMLQRPAPYDGKDAWDAYRTQFEMLAGIYRWSDAEKATYLAVSLRGSAATVLTNLPPEQRRNYEALVAALDSRFGSLHQTELNRMRLKTRTRRREESLPELAEDVERLTRLAYSGADEAMIKVLAKDQFIDSLPDEDMRLRIRQGRPGSLKETLEAALELESYQLASKQRARVVREVNLERSRASEITRQRQDASVQDGEGLLQQLVAALKRCILDASADRNRRQSSPRTQRRPMDRNNVVCWNCRKKGHFKRDCEEKPVNEDSGVAGFPRQGNGH